MPGEVVAAASRYGICLPDVALPVVYDGVRLLTYLKLAGRRLGLLINFNVPLIRDGIKR